MTEQIVDIVEGVMPGPRGWVGPRGAQGLPGVNAVPADEAVAGYILADESATADALTAMVGTRRYADGTDLVVFGDSISYGHQDGVTTRWSTQVARHYGLTEHNYAVSGAAFGFTREGIPPITKQLDTARADTSCPRDRVGIVLIGGGINDRTNLGKRQESLIGLRTVIQTCRGLYPHARIVYNCCQGGLKYRAAANASYLDQYEQMLRLGSREGAVSVPAWRLLWPYDASEVLLADGIHPNQRGHDLMAQAVIGTLDGGMYRTGKPPARFSGIVSDTTGKLVAQFGADYLHPDLLNTGRVRQIAGEITLDDDGIVHLEAVLTIAPDAGNFDMHILTLPWWAVCVGSPLMQPQTVGHYDTASKTTVYCDMGIDRILTDDGANLRITIPPRKAITDWAPQFVLRTAYRSGT